MALNLKFNKTDETGSWVPGQDIKCAVVGQSQEGEVKWR